MLLFWSEADTYLQKRYLCVDIVLISNDSLSFQAMKTLRFIVWGTSGRQ